MYSHVILGVRGSVYVRACMCVCACVPVCVCRGICFRPTQLRARLESPFDSLADAKMEEESLADAYARTRFDPVSYEHITIGSATDFAYKKEQEYKYQRHLGVYASKEGSYLSCPEEISVPLWQEDIRHWIVHDAFIRDTRLVCRQAVFRSTSDILAPSQHEWEYNTMAQKTIMEAPPPTWRQCVYPKETRLLPVVQSNASPMEDAALEKKRGLSTGPRPPTLPPSKRYRRGAYVNPIESKSCTPFSVW